MKGGGNDEMKIDALVKKLFRNRKYLRYSRSDLYKIASKQIEEQDKKRMTLKDKLRKRKKPTIKRRRSLVKRKTSPRTTKQVEKSGMDKIRKLTAVIKRADKVKKEALIKLKNEKNKSKKMIKKQRKVLKQRKR